jgi:hypothetical protein
MDTVEQRNLSCLSGNTDYIYRSNPAPTLEYRRAGSDISEVLHLSNNVKGAMLSACHAVDMEFGYETNFWTKLLFSQNN